MNDSQRFTDLYMPGILSQKNQEELYWLSERKMKDIFFNLNDESYLLKSPKKEEIAKSLKPSVSGILSLRIPRLPET